MTPLKTRLVERVGTLAVAGALRRRNHHHFRLPETQALPNLVIVETYQLVGLVFRL
jgi:hypothetical protein